MPPKFKKDPRNKFLIKLEREIQHQAAQKKKLAKLSRHWKKFIGIQAGFKIYAVHGEYVRTNISIMFGHGGHGYVHEFIPFDEIWIGTHHFDACGCRKRSINQKLSQNYFDSTVLHEITEFKEMKKGKSFWIAHNIALQKEREAGFLKNPYSDTWV